MGLGRTTAFTGWCVHDSHGRCCAGRCAELCPTLCGGPNHFPRQSPAWLGSNARPEEQHSKPTFRAGAGMLKQTFPFLFMSGGLGFALFASCSQRISWTAFLDTWAVLYVYHHSLYIVHAVPWVSANILTQRTEINPPKPRGTDCIPHDDISPTSQVTASAQNFLFSSKRHSSNRNDISTCPQPSSPSRHISYYNKKKCN